jgi:hypothetical protein
VLVNIAGGPAADSLNALIVLAARLRRELASTSTTIKVLDQDADGPAFGARALAALADSGGPLAGIPVAFAHVPYDWRRPVALASVLEAAAVPDACTALSSEGGLFEYGSDDEIVANLRVFADGTGSDAFVVGTVTREGEPARIARSTGRVPTYPRTMDAFRALARRAGWVDDRAIARPFSYNVRLVKA